MDNQFDKTNKPMDHEAGCTLWEQVAANLFDKTNDLRPLTVESGATRPVVTITNGEPDSIMGCIREDLIGSRIELCK